MAQKKLNQAAIKILVHEIVTWAANPNRGIKDDGEALKIESDKLVEDIRKHVVKHPTAFMPTIVGARIGFRWNELKIELREVSSSHAIEQLPAKLRERFKSLAARLKLHDETRHHHQDRRLEHPLLPSRGRQNVYVNDVTRPVVMKALDAISQAILSGDGASVLQQVRAILNDASK